MKGPLADVTAVVTGASRGIGLATARRLVEAGARVALVSRDERSLATRAAELEGQATAIPCDLSEPATLDAAVSRIMQAFGAAPHALINNAGAFMLAPVDQLSPDEFARALAVNLEAPFRLIRAFLPAMRERGSGHIVTIGSIADRTVFPENAAYAASKHGLRALHEVLREETRGTGVRATLVSPGPVDTPLWDVIDPDTRPGFTPRRRMLSSDAVAAAVFFALTRPPEVNVDELRLSRA